ncbi:hypothetical protein Tco_1269839 [Tanacetum coccineum]
MKRASKGYIGVDTPMFQTMLVQGQILHGEGSTIPVESHHTPISAPSTSQPPTLPPSMQTTHVAEEVATMPHDSPLLRVYSLRSDDGSMTLNKLTILYTTLSKKVETLKSDLKQTKLTYGAAYTKLVMKVKKLEHKVKLSKARRRVRLVVSKDEDELEDPSKQGRKFGQIDEDEGITLVQMSTQTQGRHEHDFEESDFEFISPEEVKLPALKLKLLLKKKTKLQLEQERLGLEEDLRLQEQLDEKERQRIVRVHKEASTFNVEEWDNIQAQIEADEELAHRYMHDPLKWRLYDTCAIHHVSTEKGHDIFMLVEKDYPLTKALMTLMLSNKMQVDEYSVMADELLRKIFILANRPRQ